MENTLEKEEEAKLKMSFVEKMELLAKSLSWCLLGLYKIMPNKDNRYHWTMKLFLGIEKIKRFMNNSKKSKSKECIFEGKGTSLVEIKIFVLFPPSYTENRLYQNELLLFYKTSFWCLYTDNFILPFSLSLQFQLRKQAFDPIEVVTTITSTKRCDLLTLCK